MFSKQDFEGTMRKELYFSLCSVHFLYSEAPVSSSHG